MKNTAHWITHSVSLHVNHAPSFTAVTIAIYATGQILPAFNFQPFCHSLFSHQTEWPYQPAIHPSNGNTLFFFPFFFSSSWNIDSLSVTNFPTVTFFLCWQHEFPVSQRLTINQPLVCHQPLGHHFSLSDTKPMSVSLVCHQPLSHHFSLSDTTPTSVSSICYQHTLSITNINQWLTTSRWLFKSQFPATPSVTQQQLSAVSYHLHTSHLHTVSPWLIKSCIADSTQVTDTPSVPHSTSITNWPSDHQGLIPDSPSVRK